MTQIGFPRCIRQQCRFGQGSRRTDVGDRSDAGASWGSQPRELLQRVDRCLGLQFEVLQEATHHADALAGVGGEAASQRGGQVPSEHVRRVCLVDIGEGGVEPAALDGGPEIRRDDALVQPRFERLASHDAQGGTSERVAVPGLDSCPARLQDDRTQRPLLCCSSALAPVGVRPP